MTIRKTITVTEPQDQWIKSQIGAGHYTNDSEYIRDLIRKDQERSSKIAAMQRLVDEAREDGISELSMAEIRELAQQRLQQ